MPPLGEEEVPQEEEDDNCDENNEGDPQDVTNKKKSTTRVVEVMPKNYLRFVYTYSIHCLDKRKVEIWLSDKIEQGRPERHIFAKLTPSDEAWAVASIVNGWDGWVQKFEHKDKKDRFHKKNLGKWTNPEDKKKKKKQGQGQGRYKYKSGWTDEGMEFYEKAVAFFQKVRKDSRFKMLVKKARDMWWDEYNAGAEEGSYSKKKRKVPDDDDEEEDEAAAPPLLFEGGFRLNNLRRYDDRYDDECALENV